MDRNTLLAIVLSIAVLVIWQAYQPKVRRPPQGKEAPIPAAAPSTAEPATPAETVAEATPSVPGILHEPPTPAAEVPVRQVVVERPHYLAELTPRGAALRYWELRDFDQGPASDYAPVVMTMESEPVIPALLTPLTELGLGDLSTALFEVEDREGGEVGFRYSQDGVRIRKTYEFGDAPYSFRLRVHVENESGRSLTPVLSVVWPASRSIEPEFKSASFAVLHRGKVQQVPISGVGKAGFFGSLFGRGRPEDREYPGEVDWAGIQTTYFLGALLPDDPSRASAGIAAVEPGQLGMVTVSFPPVELATGQSADWGFRAYLGPKEQRLLEAVGGDTVRSINLGWSWIEPLVLGFGWLLRALYSLIPNYGVAIILLTILVRVVTMPLTNRQMRSMERMRRLQPKLKELQEKHGEDRQKYSEEMMKLYRSEGVNPLGGCFPMLLQLPVFIGLFYALRSSIDLRQAPFVGWINDLSAPETLFMLPGLDLPVRVLPLVMGVSMVAQQKITPVTAGDPAQARMMMTVMPVMMTVLFYQFPSGLVLYWFVSNILAISHQLLIGRRIRATGR